MREKPVHLHPRRLADWLNPTEAKEGPFINQPIYEPVFDEANFEYWRKVREVDLIPLIATQEKKTSPS